MQHVLQAFVGAFAALVALAEVQNQSKLVRYLIALIAGAVLAMLLGWIVNRIPWPPNV